MANNNSVRIVNRWESLYMDGEEIGWPLIDISAVDAMPCCPSLAPSCNKETFKELVLYVLWNYRCTKLPIQVIDKACRSSGLFGLNVQKILEHYGVVNPARQIDTNRGRKKIFKRSRLKLLRRLHNEGLSQAAIRRVTGLDDSAVRRYLRHLGLVKPKQARKNASWVLSSDVKENTALTYSKYCHRIRHYTNSIYNQYKEVIDPKGLRARGYHLDHKLSVFDGFNKADRPIPWQLLCHPANLQLLTEYENYSKGKNSSIGPKKLLKQIAEYEKLNGKVLLPKLHESTGRPTYNRTAAETVAQSIKNSSAFSFSELLSLSRGKKVPVAKHKSRAHFTRAEYTYVASLFLGHGKSVEHIADCLEVQKCQVVKMLERMKIPTEVPGPTWAKAVSMYRRKKAISRIANHLSITKRAVLVCLRKQENET